MTVWKQHWQGDDFLEGRSVFFVNENTQYSEVQDEDRKDQDATPEDEIDSRYIDEKKKTVVDEALDIFNGAGVFQADRWKRVPGRLHSAVSGERRLQILVQQEIDAKRSFVTKGYSNLLSRVDFIAGRAEGKMLSVQSEYKRILQEEQAYSNLKDELKSRKSTIQENMAGLRQVRSRKWYNPRKYTKLAGRTYRDAKEGIRSVTGAKTEFEEAMGFQHDGTVEKAMEATESLRSKAEGRKKSWEKRFEKATEQDRNTKQRISTALGENESDTDILLQKYFSNKNNRADGLTAAREMVREKDAKSGALLQTMQKKEERIAELKQKKEEEGGFEDGDQRELDAEEKILAEIKMSIHGKIVLAAKGNRRVISDFYATIDDISGVGKMQDAVQKSTDRKGGILDEQSQKRVDFLRAAVGDGKLKKEGKYLLSWRNPDMIANWNNESRSDFINDELYLGEIRKNTSGETKELHFWHGDPRDKEYIFDLERGKITMAKWIKKEDGKIVSAKKEEKGRDGKTVVATQKTESFSLRIFQGIKTAS